MFTFGFKFAMMHGDAAVRIAAQAMHSRILYRFYAMCKWEPVEYHTSTTTTLHTSEQ